MMYRAIEAEITAIVRRALEEDLGSGDVTTECIVPTDLWLNGRLVARAAGVIAGLEIARLVFTQLDERVQFETLVKDGEAVEAAQILAEWDPYSIPIVAEIGGTVKYGDVIEGVSMRSDIVASSLGPNSGTV